MFGSMEILMIIIGLAAGGGLAWQLLRGRLRETHNEVARQQAELLSLDERLRSRDRQLEELKEEISQLDLEAKKSQEQLLSEAERRAAAEEKNSRLPELENTLKHREKGAAELAAENSLLKSRISELDTRIEEERKRAAEKLTLLMEAKEQMQLEFKSLADRIFEDKGKKFTEQNKTNIDTLLSPMREQLKDFRKKVEDVYDKESKDRMSLFHEINNLKNLNQKISADAINLTRALQGQSKTQGAWGEMILERILEESGLHKGREYETQESFKAEDGRMRRPDIIVHLPDNKDVVIDSKVTLTAYERYCSAENEEERGKELRLHVVSVRSHLKQLSDKRYEDLKGLRSLDFVLMFLPIEGAFMAALDADPKLFTEAFEKNIMLVCPSTLLATLRTINNIWRYEDQNKNAQEIANRAGALYDKFVGFIESLDDVGLKIGKANEAYEKAKGQLHTGKGNLVRHTELLKVLGAKTNKSLPETLLEQVEEDN